MAFCPTCGAQAQGAFCARCGAPLAPAPPPPQQPFGQPQYNQPAPSAAGLEQNVAAALCYLAGLISGVIFLVLEPYNRDKVIRFHAFQSIFLNIGLIVLNIALTIALGIMRAILPYGLRNLLSAMAGLAFFVAFVGIWLFLMYKAYNREKFKIPIIGDLAEKQA